MKKILLCGTHIHQYNGYSKIVYEILYHLGFYKDIHITLFGFQNFYTDDIQHHRNRIIPHINIDIIDPYKYETYGKTKEELLKTPNKGLNSGFGEHLIVDIITLVKPDIVIIYNDPGVILNLYRQIFNISDENSQSVKFKKNLKFQNIKFIPYLDIVYPNMNNRYLKIINELSDDIIFFSKSWQKMGWQFKDKKGTLLNHGINVYNYFPVDESLACQLLKLNENAFKILNLNRNQPRKQLDIAIRGYIYIINKYNLLNSNIIFIIGTSLSDSWDIKDIIEQESYEYELDIEKLSQRFQIIDKPQMRTDLEINLYYNACQIGINSCNGEGFGLCNFEHAAIGKPQIVSNVGTFNEIFNKDNSILINPITTSYIPHMEHGLSGETDICNYKEFGEAIYTYYKNDELREKHGKNCRKTILKNYKWNEHIKNFHNYLISI